MLLFPKAGFEGCLLHIMQFPEWSLWDYFCASVKKQNIVLCMCRKHNCLFQYTRKLASSEHLFRVLWCRIRNTEKERIRKKTAQVVFSQQIVTNAYWPCDDGCIRKNCYIYYLLWSDCHTVHVHAGRYSHWCPGCCITSWLADALKNGESWVFLYPPFVCCC